MRGEHSVAGGTSCGHGGSSPHARGALVYEMCRLNPSGIIPACAGSTFLALHVPQLCEDHPRMRGEHPSSSPSRFGLRGSSPHARGALDALVGQRVSPGIIPACAGSTTCGVCALGPPRDHPRMRGEHCGISPSAVNSWGSSPHARGAPPCGSCNAPLARIIPACAGSTSGRAQAPRRT